MLCVEIEHAVLIERTDGRTDWQTDGHKKSSLLWMDAVENPADQLQKLLKKNIYIYFNCKIGLSRRIGNAGNLNHFKTVMQV